MNGIQRFGMYMTTLTFDTKVKKGLRSKKIFTDTRGEFTDCVLICLKGKRPTLLQASMQFWKENGASLLPWPLSPSLIKRIYD